MPLEYELHPDKNLMIIRVIEAFTLDDFEKTMPAVLNDADFISGMNALWDVRDGTLDSLSGKDMHMIAEYISSKQSERGAGYKVALVVTSELDSGLSRMYDIISENLPNLCRNFKDFDEALNWINE